MKNITKIKKMLKDMRPQKADVWVAYYELRTMLIILTYNDALVTDIEEGDITKISFKTSNRASMLNVEQDLKKFYVDVYATSIQ